MIFNSRQGDSSSRVKTFPFYPILYEEKNAEGLRDLWETIKHTNIWEPQRRRKEQNKVSEEIMAENHPNLMKNIIHPQSWTNFNKDKLKEIHTYSHLQDEDKKKILKAPRENSICTRKGTSVRLIADFSSETLGVSRQ